MFQAIPASERYLSLFVAYLAKPGLKLCSIKVFKDAWMEKGSDKRERLPSPPEFLVRVGGEISRP